MAASRRAGDSADGIVTFLDYIGRLKTSKRAGWVRHAVPLPESIADHMFRCAVTALLLPPDDGVDPHKTALVCLVHDIAEV